MKVRAALMILGLLAQFYCVVPTKFEQKECPPGCETVKSSSANPCPDCDCRNLIKKKDNVYVRDEHKCPPGCVSQLIHTGPCPECNCKNETKEKGSQYLTRFRREEKDIDECKKNYPCSQHCHNTHGSHKCSCEEGYISTNDGITCKANSSVNPQLIFSNEFNIFKMDIDGSNAKLLARNLESSWGLDFDWIENCIYFSDEALTDNSSSSIKRMCLDTPEPQIIQSDYIGYCVGLAVDWIGRNFYWIHNKGRTIGVSSLDGKFRKILIRKGLKKARSIVLDPFRGYMYWADWGNNPYIGKAGMDGSEFSRLIIKNLGWPNALTIDYVTKELFWADVKKDCISVSDLDGLNRRTIVKKGQFSEDPRITSITVFEDQLYWSNYNKLSIERCHKYHCDNYSTVSTTKHKIVAVKVIHPYRQKMLKTANPCATAGCKALCLLKPGGDATCSCPEDHFLEVDNVSCLRNCTISQFQCKSTYKCIDKGLYCDTMDDCEDKSDEPAECKPFRCNAVQFQCDNFNCIPTQEKCDGYSHCGDMSDEQDCEIDECTKNYPCSQHCHNAYDSYKCSCEEGYFSTNDGITCKANSSVKPMVIFSNEYNIFQMDLHGRNTELLVKNLSSSVNLDFDWIENCIYFTDNKRINNITMSSIKRMCLATPEPQVLMTGYIYTCDGLAVDWIGRHIYWIDGWMQTIEVSNLDGNFRKVLISGLDTPRTIIVDPFRGYMYWTDLSHNPYIGKAGMDGSEFSRLITKSIKWPSGLTIDYVTKQIYWTDYSEEYLAVADLDGLNRRILLKKDQFADVAYIFSLTIFEDHLYWSNWDKNTIETCHKYHCNNVSTIGTTNYKPMDLEVVHPYRQVPLKTVNPCDTAGCKVLCILKPGGGAKCSCPDDHFLEDDNVSCRSNCTTSQFLCKSTYKCIPKKLYCDTMDDCGDNSDEPVECVPFRCNVTTLMCDNFKCIPLKEKCDGCSQCGDMSDEKNCDEYRCLSSQFKCPRNGTTQARCISLIGVCDYVSDCIGGEDELNCGEIDECKKNLPCSQHCDNTHGSYNCSCDEGYLSTNDGITCKANSSVNPMLIYSNDSDIFQIDLHGHNSTVLGSDLYNSMAIDFDWIKNCIYLSDNGDISSIIRMCLDTPEPQVIHTGRVQVCEGLAVDWIGSNLYWTDAGTRTIEVSTLDGNFRKILLSEGIIKPRAIVLDPFRGYMYWTEWGSKPYIGKAGMDGTEFSRLITESLGCPNALTIDYVTKELFWADAKEKYIAFTDLDGRNRRIIAKKGKCLEFPYIYSLAVFEDYLYWSNWNTNDIESCHKYHCNNFSTIFKSDERLMDIKVVHPYRQTPLQTANPCTTAGCKFLCLLKPGGEAKCSCPENHVLEDDNVSCRSNCTSSEFMCKSSYKCIPKNWYCDNEDDCGDNSDEPQGCFELRCLPKQFRCANFNCIKQQQVCDGYSQCGDMSDEQDCEIDDCKKNYPCSQHCDNTDGSYKCSCGEGYLSINDGVTCKANSPVKPMLIFSNEYNIFQMDLHGRYSKVLGHNNISSMGLDFDWIDNCIYFSHNTKRSEIKRRCLNAPEQQIIQTGLFDACEGIAVDWIGRNLYWTNSGTYSIEVSNLDGKFRKILFSEELDKPRAIVVDPFRGYIYWTDWGRRPYIGKAGMDGTEFSRLITEPLGWPNALTIDYVTKEIFWADAKEEYIAVADLDGLNRKVIVKKGQFEVVPYIYSLTVFEDQLYWSNWNTKSIERCHKYHCDKYSTIGTTNYYPRTLRVVHPYRQTPLQTANPCDTAGCKFLCLLKPGGDATCSCPENHVLEDDNVSCRSNCTTSQFLCESTYKCIPRGWYCDTEDDCGDKSDEPADCQPFLCDTEQFQCDNFNCIPLQEMCDGYSQCGDMSDEQDCEVYPCLSGQFKCPRNGITQARCISLLSLCNDVKDCIGEEDEINCGGGSKPSLSCSPPICAHGCTIDVSAKPCPVCKCNQKNEKKKRCKSIKWVNEFQEKILIAANEKDCDDDEFDEYDDEGISSRARVPCFPVTCRDGCRINVHAKPCPVCTCRDENESLNHYERLLS